MNAFDLVGGAAQSEKILCVLIGGFALHFHGVDRQTMDVDFLVSPEEFAKLEKHLTNAGCQVGERSDLCARFIPPSRPKLPLDFLFADSETVGRIKSEGQIVQIGGREFVVPSLRHLVALKLHAIRQNPARQLTDMADIVSLLQRHPENLSRLALQELCGTYGTPELLTDLLRHCPEFS